MEPSLTFQGAYYLLVKKKINDKDWTQLPPRGSIFRNQSHFMYFLWFVLMKIGNIDMSFEYYIEFIQYVSKLWNDVWANTRQKKHVLATMSKIQKYPLCIPVDLEETLCETNNYLEHTTPQKLAVATMRTTFNTFTQYQQAQLADLEAKTDKLKSQLLNKMVPCISPRIKVIYTQFKGVNNTFILHFVMNLRTPTEKKNEKSEPKACITDILTMKMGAQVRFTDSVTKSAQLKLKEQELIQKLNAL